MDRLHGDLRRHARDRRRQRARAAAAVPGVQLGLVQRRARRPDPVDRRVHDRPAAAAVAPVGGHPGRPARRLLRPHAPGPGRPRGRRRRRDGADPAPPPVRRPARDRLRGDLPLRRPPPLDEDGHAAHPHGPRDVPRRRGGDLAAGRRAGAGRRRGRVADRAADRHAGPAARAQPRVRGARLRHRPSLGLHDAPRRVPGRQADRGQGHPRQRPADGRRLHVPPERLRAGARRRHPRQRRQAALDGAGRR